MSRQSSDEPSIFIAASNSKIEQVQFFKYLESWLTADARCEKEIKKRHKSSEIKFQPHEKHFQGSQAFHVPKNKTFEMFRALGSRVWL